MYTSYLGLQGKRIISFFKLNFFPFTLSNFCFKIATLPFGYPFIISYVSGPNAATIEDAGKKTLSILNYYASVLVFSALRLPDIEINHTITDPIPWIERLDIKYLQ